MPSSKPPHGPLTALQEAAVWKREARELRLAIRHLREALQLSRAREDHLRYLAFHDDLTMLPNGRSFRERVSSALRDSSPYFAVLLLDVEGFWRSSDEQGHDTGDHMLRIVAARLSNALPTHDLSRIGFDQFACMIPGVGQREPLQKIAAALFKAISTPLAVGSRTFTLLPSIGIAVSPVDGTSTEALMQAASRAMSAAKRKQSAISFSEARVGVTPLYIVKSLPRN